MPARALAVFFGIAAAAAVARAGTPADGFAETDVVAGLTAPTAAAFLPDGRLLVTQVGGELLLVDGGTVKTLITIPTCAAPDQGLEIGLLGIAVHPDWPGDRRVYLYRTRRGAGPCTQPAPDRVNELICVEVAPGGSVDPATLVVLLTGIRTDTGYHDGGGLRVGPDRMLYVGVGDTGAGDGGAPGASTNPYAQDPNALEGKILRVDLDGQVPGTNPFAGQPGKRGEVFALGFRNPFRFGFDPVNGKLWAGDVGEDTEEELDVVVPGGNYGWPRCEGTLPAGCAQPGDTAPAFSYPHAGATSLGESVIGGAFANGGAFAALAGEYFFADFGDGHGPGTIYHGPLDATRSTLAGTPAAAVTGVEGPVDLFFGPDGALYYVAYAAGAVRQVTTSLAAPPCASVAECTARLAAALPQPQLAATSAARKAAKRLARLDRKVTAALKHAARVRRPARQYARVRKLLDQLLGAARTASGRGTLGVPFGTVESAVGALVALLPPP